MLVLVLAKQQLNLMAFESQPTLAQSMQMEQPPVFSLPWVTVLI